MSVLSKPELSIILITYNQSAYIERAIQGLLSQDYDFKKTEIVVADDFSTDNTLDLIKRLLPENAFFRIRYLDCSINHGITRNYERSIAACEGEFIAILEGDDYWT
jgi:glycosyltransferase involved in cell wall biosynthesis